MNDQQVDQLLKNNSVYLKRIAEISDLYDKGDITEQLHLESEKLLTKVLENSIAYRKFAYDSQR